MEAALGMGGAGAEKQIPCGDDNKNGKCNRNGNGDCNGNGKGKGERAGVV